MGDEPKRLRLVGATDPDPDVVRLFEGFLERARRGEVVAAAIATLDVGGDVSTGISAKPGANVWSLMGAVRWLAKTLDEVVGG